LIAFLIFLSFVANVAELEIDPAQENPQVLNSNKMFIGFALTRKSFDAIRVTVHCPRTPDFAENPANAPLSERVKSGGQARMRVFDGF
jgi:hypothetical protein